MNILQASASSSLLPGKKCMRKSIKVFKDAIMCKDVCKDVGKEMARG